MGRLLFSFKSSKAWVAGLVAAAGAFAVAMNDGTLSPMEVGNMVGAFLSGLGFVFSVRNERDRDENQD